MSFYFRISFTKMWNNLSLSCFWLYCFCLWAAHGALPDVQRSLVTWWVMKLEAIDKEWVLLDACLTVFTSCNPDLVKIFKPCAPGDSITVLTNGGSNTFKLNKHTKMSILPIKVHYNESFMANILSFWM